MKSLRLKCYLINFLLVSFKLNIYAQAPACVKAKGLAYFLDGYLAAVGACNCQRSPILLTDYQKCNNDPYVLEFEDNFDGDTLDLSKWNLAPAKQGATDGQQRQDVFLMNNIVVKDGSCHIIGKKETIISRSINYLPDGEILDDGRPNLREYNYTSSLLSSKKQFLHGKYEIKCKMPKGNGLWPAFWLFGWGNERYNELDIFDCYKGIDKIVNCLYHDFEGLGDGPTGCHSTYGGYNLSDWHIFTCLFEPDQVSFLVDDQLLSIHPRLITSAKNIVSCEDDIDAGTYFQLTSYPIEPMNILFNLAITSDKGPGGSVPVDETTPFPCSFDVDYIRFWKKVPDPIIVKPNPTTNFVTIHSNISRLKYISLINLDGITLSKIETSAPDALIDLSGFPDGLYIIQVNFDGGSVSKKIIKISR